MFDPRTRERCIFVGGLAWSVEQSDVYKLFAKCGTVEEVLLAPLRAPLPSAAVSLEDLRCVWPCVAVLGSVGQCGVVWCGVGQCGAVWCSVVQRVAVWCSVVQCGTVC